MAHRGKVTRSKRVRRANGQRLTRHIVGNEIRFTIAGRGFQKLVAIAIPRIATNQCDTERFIWICNGFST